MLDKYATHPTLRSGSALRSREILEISLIGYVLCTIALILVPNFNIESMLDFFFYKNDNFAI